MALSDTVPTCTHFKATARCQSQAGLRNQRTKGLDIGRLHSSYTRARRSLRKESLAVGAQQAQHVKLIPKPFGAQLYEASVSSFPLQSSSTSAAGSFWSTGATTFQLLSKVITWVRVCRWHRHMWVCRVPPNRPTNCHPHP